MLNLLRALIAHKGYANASMLRAISEHESAASNPELIALLHHVYVANLFWYLACVGEAFDSPTSPESLGQLRGRFESLQEQEERWLAGVSEADMVRVLEHPRIPGGRCTVADALVQMSLHSQGHRAQCAKMLRAFGTSPPTTDYILWIAGAR